jgi:hypothetical protein
MFVTVLTQIPAVITAVASIFFCARFASEIRSRLRNLSSQPLQFRPSPFFFARGVAHLVSRKSVFNSELHITGSAT